jgi:TP901 family phage tail tape measure protein
MAKDLGNATISINVAVTGLAKSTTALEAFFDKLTTNISLVNLKLRTLQTTLASLGNSGTGRLVSGMREAANAVGKLNSGIKRTDEFIENAVKANAKLDDNFKKSKVEVEKLTLELKEALAIIKQMKTASVGATPKGTGTGGGSKPPVDEAKTRAATAKAAANSLRDVSSSLKDVGRQALIFGAILAALFVPVIKEGAAFEQSIANVASVIGELTTGTAGAQARIQSLSDAILNLGKTTEFTAVAIADAARQLALSGFSDAEIKDSIEAIVSLASATNTELEKTALIAARITRAFGLAASSFDTVADTLAIVASNSNTTLEGLGESFKLASPIAAAYGQSIENIATAFGVLGDAGIQNSRAGTGISRLFSEFTEKEEDITSLLESVGSSFDKVDLTKNNFTDVVDEFSRLSELGKITKADIFDIFDQRSARTFVSLINSGSEALDDLKDKLGDAAGAAQRIRDFRIETIAGQFKILQSAAAAAAVTITQALEPAIRSVIGFVTSLIQKFQEFAASNSTTIDIIGKIAAGIAILSVSIGGILITLGGFAALVAAPLFFSALGVSITSLTGILAIATSVLLPLAPIILGVAAAIGLLVFAMGSVEDQFVKVTDKNVTFERNLIKTTALLNKAAESTRELSKRLELLRDLPTLNIRQLKELTEALDGKGLFNVDESKENFEALVKQQQALQREFTSTENKIKELSKLEGFTQKLFGPLVKIFDGTFNEAGFLEDAREQTQKQLKEINKEIDKEYELIRGTQKLSDIFEAGDFSQQEFELELELLKVQQDLERFQDIRESEPTPQELNTVNKLIPGAEEAEERLKKQLAQITKFRKQFTDEQLELISEVRDAGGSDKEILEGFINLEEVAAATRKAVAELGDSRKALKKIFEDVREDTADTGINSFVQEINDTTDEAEEAVQKLSDGIEGQIKDLEKDLKNTNIDLTRDIALNLAGKDNDEDIEKARTRIADLEEAISKHKEDQVEIGLDLLDIYGLLNIQLEAQDKKSREAQEKILQDAALAAAQAKENLVEEIVLTEKLGQARIKAALEEFESERPSDQSQADFLIEQNKLRDDLNTALDLTITKKLKLVKLSEEILDIEKEINDEFKTKLQLDTDAATDKEKERIEKLTDLQVEGLKDVQAAEKAISSGLLSGKELIDTQTDLTKLKADLAKIDALKKKAAQLGNRDRAKATKDQLKKEEKFLRESALKAAIRAEDVDEEFRLKRLEGIEKINEDIEKSQIDAAKKQSERIKRTAELDLQLAEDKEKREQKIAKDAAGKAKKLDTTGQKTANKLAGERDRIEKSIFDKLVAQVKTLRQAKELLGFLARIESARKAKAEREGLGAISATRRVSGLEAKRAELVSQGKDTRAVDNDLARARLDLSIKTAASTKALEAVGAGQGDLASILSKLNTTLQQNGNRLPIPVNLPNVRPNPVPPGGNPNAPQPLSPIFQTFIDGVGLSADEVGDIVLESYTKLWKRLFP